MSTQPRCEWSILPSVILLKILSYLPLQDKLSASSTCFAWRSMLFYPNFWQKILLVYKSSDPWRFERSKFLATTILRTLRSCSLEFESVQTNCLLHTEDVLIGLKRNSKIKELVLLPTNCHTLTSSSVGYSEKYSDTGCMNNNYYDICKKFCRDKQTCSPNYSYQFIESAMDCIQSIISNARHFKTLSLGCLNELTEMSDMLLPLLERHATTLTTLGLASVKTDPNSYPLLHITPEHFSCFRNLQVLTVDYDYVSNDLLDVLARPFCTPLKRLVFHVHGIEPSHSGTTELAWYQFKQRNQECALTINLLHSYEGVEQLNSGLLRPSMPLTVLRSFFCEWINVPALVLITNWYSKTLQHLQIVDSLDNRNWMTLTADFEDDPVNPDPLVMLAWRCTKLRHLTLLGYRYNGMDLIAIARLRGSSLAELVFPKFCLETDDEWIPIPEDELEHTVQDVSLALGRPWQPLDVKTQHPCLQSSADPNTDEYFMPILQKDAMPI